MQAHNTYSVEKCKRITLIRSKMAIKTSLKNVGDHTDAQTHVWSIPLYMLFRMKDYIYAEMGW